jgi:hypothetical protein
VDLARKRILIGAHVKNVWLIKQNFYMGGDDEKSIE